MNRPEDNWYDDFSTEPIGGENPYYQCYYCQISGPQINYRLEGHAPNCEYRQKQEADLVSRGKLPRGTKVIKMKTPKYPHEKQP